MNRRGMLTKYVLAGLAVAVVVTVIVLAFRRADSVGPDDGELLIDGDVILSVEPDVDHVESFGGTLTVYHGAAAPGTLGFEVAGVEQPLVQGKPNWDENNFAGDVPIVYVGDVNGRSVFVHTNGTIGWFERLEANLRGSQIGDHICMSVGSYDGVNGGVGFCGTGTSHSGRFIKNVAGELQISWATWIDLPVDTTVALAQVDGQAVLWQRPRGNTVFFDLDDTQGDELRLVALDAEGNEIAVEDVSVFWSSP